jgi:serine/threonine protein kinase
MEALETVDGISLIASALAVAAYFALRQMASRMGDDIYSLFKRLGGWLFRRRKKAAEPVAEVAAAADGSSAISALAAGSETQDPEVDSAGSRPDAADPKPMLSTGRGDYFGFEFLAEGDVARLFRADLVEKAGERRSRVVIKIARGDDAASALRHEVEVLRELHRDAGAHGKHLPRVVDQFCTAEGRPGTVFEALEGLTLTQLRERFADGIEPRHVLWMFRRGLSILGYAHGRGILHGNLRPEHFLVSPDDHNVWLLDWTCAIQRPADTGQGFRAADPLYGAPEAHRRQPPVPASDLYALGQLMVFAFGGDPSCKSLPGRVPEPLERFTRFFLKEGPLQRPQDAWEMYHALEKIRDQIYGPHRFVEFQVD